MASARPGRNIQPIQIQHLLKLNSTPDIDPAEAIKIQIQHLLKLNYYYYHHNIPTVGIQIQHLLKLNKKYNKITA